MLYDRTRTRSEKIKGGHMKLAEMTKAKRKKKQVVGLKSLVEGIILQSFADLWVTEEYDGSVKFFMGEGFKICAGIAGINLHDQVKLLGYANRTIALQAAIRARGKSTNRKAVDSPDKFTPRNVKLSSVPKTGHLHGVCSI